MSKLPISRRPDFLGAMANEQRLKVLEMLAEGEIAVTALSEKTGLRQATVSRHLARLRIAKMVAVRRDAQSIYYSVTCEHVQEMLGVLRKIFEPTLALPVSDQDVPRDLVGAQDSKSSAQ